MDLSQIKETNKKLINSSIKENRRVSVGDYNINRIVCLKEAIDLDLRWRLRH